MHTNSERGTNKNTNQASQGLQGWAEVDKKEETLLAGAVEEEVERKVNKEEAVCKEEEEEVNN